MNKYEKLIEHIINDEEGKARALFHEIVVEKSRDIYESLMDEDQFAETVGGDQVNGMMDEIQADESGLPEDEEMDIGGDDEMLGGDDMGGDDMGGDDMGGEDDLETKVMDLESELDALKAEFEQLMGGEAGDDDMGGDEMGDDMGGDDMGDEEAEEGMYESAEEEEEEEVTESAEEEEEEEEEEEVAESKSGYKSEVDLMREYVEKLGSYDKVPAGAEGEEAAKGGSVNVNKQSIVAGKNDMGGTTANIAKGGNEADPKSTPPAKTSGLLKQGGEIDVAKRNVNKVGGNKGAQNFYSDKAKAKPAEGSTTDGSMSVAKDSILKKIN